MYIQTTYVYNIQDFEIHIQIAFTIKLAHTDKFKAVQIQIANLYNSNILECNAI